MATLTIDLIGRPPYIPHNEIFEKSLIHALAYPSYTPPPSVAVAIVPLAPSILPVPLNHPSRQHPSDFPGIYLTHPDGSLWGGPAPPDTVSRKGVLEDQIKAITGARNDAEMHEMIMERKARAVERVTRAAQRLEADGRRNEDLGRQIAELKQQREVERKVEEMMRGRNRERREKMGV